MWGGKRGGGGEGGRGQETKNMKAGGGGAGLEQRCQMSGRWVPGGKYQHTLPHVPHKIHMHDGKLWEIL